ncbi:MAG TPA: hypothetical protein VFH33_00065, partial [Candidatus Krumholzibacteria bacterium]|nr:hypothetical protein [Candidatus Krumholzibacteria bacterium]
MNLNAIKPSSFAILAAFVALCACTAPKDKPSPNEKVHKDGKVSTLIELSPDIPHPLYSQPDNWWNVDISNAPVDPTSPVMIAW